MEPKKQGFDHVFRDAPNPPAKIVKKAKTLPEVVQEMADIAKGWGGVTESIRQLDKDGRIREMSVTIKFTAV